jgi:serine O-acetyltransferase
MWKVLRADLERHGGARSFGFWALAVYRYGRWSQELPNPAARWLTSKLYGVANQGVDMIAGVSLDRKTEIGEELHIIHTGMISIHPDVKIGERVGIMHGVTIGTHLGPGVPTIGNDVFIGCHASILGDITIGDGARIAANSLVIADVPAGAIAVGVPARVMPNMSAQPPRTPPTLVEPGGNNAAKPTRPVTAHDKKDHG